MTHCRGSRLALLHRVKERKTPSLSAQASFAPFSLKVAWSGKSLHVLTLIVRRHLFHTGTSYSSVTACWLQLTNQHTDKQRMGICSDACAVFSRKVEDTSMDFFMAGKVTEVQSVYMFVVGTIEA